jgi:hypothetical protein
MEEDAAETAEIVDQLRSRSSRQLAKGRLVPPPLLNGDEDDEELNPPMRPDIPMTFMVWLKYTGVKVLERRV